MMKIFKRRPEPLQFDEHLTYFTTGEASTFRELVRASFAEVGRDVTVYADHVEDRTGTTFGLWNIGALCAREDLSDWADLIDDHVRSVTTPTRELDDLTSDELEAGVYLQLVDAGSLSEPELLGYAREVAPGLLEVISIDLPDAVATPPEDVLTARRGLEDLRECGRANLLSLLSGDLVGAETVEGDSGGRFVTITGASFFTASLALLLPETIEQFSGESDEGRGVLVAVPFRHQLLYRVIDGPDAARALDDMFDAARHRFMTNAGPVSPDVYWVRNHRWVPVTSMDGHKPKVVFDSGIADAFR
jgi:hypothetical protein